MYTDIARNGCYTCMVHCYTPHWLNYLHDAVTLVHVLTKVETESNNSASIVHVDVYLW